MTRKLLAGLFFALCCSTLTSIAGADPLPAEVYAALPHADNVRLSPDGKAVAMIAPIGGHMGVLVWRPEGPQDWFNPNGADQLNWLAWKSPDRLVLSIRFSQKEDGQQVGVTRLLFTSVTSKNSVKVTFHKPIPPPNVVILGKKAYEPPHLQDRIISLLPEDPDHVMLAAANNDWAHPDAMLIDVQNGVPRTFLHQNGTVVRWLADPDGALRLRQSLENGEGPHSALVVRVRDSEDSEWREIHRNEADFGARFIPLAFSRQTPSSLFVLADQENGRLALQTFDTRSLTMGPPLAADPQCDIEPVLHDNQVVGTINPCRSPAPSYLDAGWQQDQAKLQQALKTEQIELIDRTPDGKITLVRSSFSATAPPVYWYFDQSGPTKSLLKIIGSYDRLSPSQVAATQRINFTGRDGMVIPALLTLPPTLTERTEPIGFVVLPHGGPTAHDSIEWDWVVQFIASRGYGVLQPQFRGSTGYGAAFQRAGYRQWGGKMQDDVTDGTNWLIAQKLADPKRICIAGISYGGYAALMGGATRPDLYQCVVAVAPVTDIARLLIERDHNEFGEINRDRIVGDQGVIAGESPIDQAGNLTRPVLLIHGRKDFTVPIGHSEDLEQRLKQAGHPAKVIYLDEADHFFSRADDRLACLQALDAFLTAALGSGIQQPRS